MSSWHGTQVLMVMTAAFVDAGGRMTLKSYTTYLTNVSPPHLSSVLNGLHQGPMITEHTQFFASQ